AIILGSPEYFAKHGSNNPSFVDALYRDVLGRSSAGDAGAAAMVAALNARTVTREQAAVNVLLSPQGTNFTVALEYVQVFGRGAGSTDKAHQDTLAKGIRDGIPEGVLVASLIGDLTQEFFSKIKN